MVDRRAEGSGLIERPIIILSSPRAGSTLLFETLCHHPELWSIGGESHALIEHIPALSTVARGCKSNALTATDATPIIIRELQQRFLQNARNHCNQPYQNGTIRLLEKTPKNALRVSFFNQVFPDAFFIYLVRDPKENISSIMDAWQSGRFITYPNLPGWNGHWSLLLPDGWQQFRGKPLQEVAAFQWASANAAILHGLANVPGERKLTISYRDLTEATAQTLHRIAQKVGLDVNGFGEKLHQNLPFSRFTLTEPKADKWHKNAKKLHTVKKYLAPLIAALNKELGPREIEHLNFDLSTEVGQPKASRLVQGSSQPNTGRNAPCPCGSGEKYKHCHGQLG